MSSFKDLVKQVNEGKYKTVSATGQKQSSNEKEEEKKSSFRDLVKQVNDGSFNVSSKLKGSDVSTWYSKVSDIGKRSSSYLSGDGYKKADTSLADEIETYLSQAADVGQFIRANKSNFSNYDDTISTYYQAVNYLRDLKSGVKSSNEYYSQWESEEDYNAHIARQKDYDAKKNFDIEAGRKEISELEQRRSELVKSRTQPANNYLTGNSPLNSLNHGARSQDNGTYDKEIADLDALISQKKQYLNQAKYIQDGIALSSVAENDDFRDYSGYVSTAPDGQTPAKGTSYINLPYRDLTYEYINNRNGARDQITQSLLLYDPAGSAKSLERWEAYDYMSYSEISIYNYHYAKEGKEAAEKYLDSIQESLNLRKATSMYGHLEDNTALELAFGIAAGLDQFESGVKNLFNSEDSYIPQTATQMASGMVREDLADVGPKLPDWLGGASIGQVGYDTITTTSNMAPSIMTSMALGIMNPAAGQWAGTALMGASAAGNAYQEALNMGYDKGQARMYAALVGGSEAGLQYLLGGIGSLGGKLSGNAVTKIMNGVDNAFARTAIKLGGNMLSEGVEEGLQEILTPWFQNLIMHTDEDINWSEVAYSTLLGALTAGFMEGGTTISGEVNTYKTGKQLQAADISAQRLAEIGNTFSADTVAHQLAGKVNENTGAYTMGRLFNEIGATLTEQNVNDITQALVEKGMTEDIANKNAEVMAYIIEGGEVSNFQMRMIEKNEILSKVMKEVIIDPNSTLNQRNKGYNDALMALAQEKTGSDAPQTDTAEPAQENAPAADKVDAPEEIVSEAAPAASDDALMAVAESVAQDQQNKSGTVGSAMFTNENQRIVAEHYSNLEATTDNPVIANMDVASRNKLTAAYDPASGMIPKAYVVGSNEAFYYGFEGIPMTTMSKTSIAMALSPEQRAYAYNLGVEAAQRGVEAQSAAMGAAYAKAQEVLAGQGITTKNGTVIVKKKGAGGKAILETSIKESSMTRQQKASYKLADAVAKAVGTDIHVYAGMTEYGKYDEETGEIWLNVNANISGQSMMAFTLGHELVHMAKQWSPKKFKAFADFLLAEYGKKGVAIDALIQEQIDNAQRNGIYLDPHAAYEEVIADACQRMLLDSDAVKKMAAFKEQNPDTWNRIKQAIEKFINKIRAYFKGAEPDSQEAQLYKELDDAAKKILENMFVDMVMDAGEHLSTIRNAFGKGTVVEANENGEFTLAKSKDGSKFLYNDYTWERGGRDTLAAALKAEGFSQEDIDAALTIMDGKHKLVKELGKKFPEQNRINEATITTDLKDGHSVLSALVSNGDYPVNIDLLMVCKKRKAYQRVINRLCETGLIQQATVDALAIAEINKILGKYGFETACLGCFVESRRLRIQEWAQTICKEWNAEVKKRNPNAKAFGFGKGEATLTQDEVMQLIGQLEAGGKKNDQGNLNLGQGSAVKRMGVLLDKVPALRKTLSVEDLITPDGLSSLRRFDSNLFSMVKSRYGSNSPKFVQEFNPYNHELAMYGTVPAEYSSLREYLYAIGGARMQSFSDFIVENWFDYCQIVADLAARKLPMHTYTKEIALVKLLGMTGIKINMSLIPDIDRSLSKEFAGLTRNADGELELIWSDKDRFKATGGKSYMQSINFNDAMALQNDPRYSANVGTIAIGVSDIQIRMMLNDPRIRMVIPYHSSGMNPIFADLMGTSYYKDYTLFQNTTVKQLYNSKGQKVSLKLDKTQAGKLTSGFQFNEVLQELGDARAAAEAYKEWCADASKHTITIKGETYTAELTPKFDDFSGEKNYYKLLEDFNTYDCISEQAAPQGDVQQIYPEDFNKILEDELKSQEKHRQKQVANQAFDKAMAEIESYLRTHTKADTVFYAEQHGVSISAKDKKLNAEDKKKLAELRKGVKNSLPKVKDTEYLAAVKRGDMETVKRMVAAAAEKAGLSTEHLFHGTPAFGFTTIDTSESDDSISFFATNNPEVAQGYMPWYEDDASDKYHNEPRRIGKGIKQRAITNRSSIEDVVKVLNATFDNEYKNARAATDKETLDSFKLYHIPEMVEAASELINRNVPQKIKDLCGLVVEANKKDTFAAWAEVSKRYKEFETAEIPYDPFDWSNDILWSRVVVDLQSISKMARTEPIWNNGAVIMKSALVDRYNTFLGGDSIGMYDFYGNNKNQLVIWGEGSNWKSIPLGEHDTEYRKWLKETRGNDVPAGRSVRASTRDISAFAKHMGYRSVVFVDIYDAGSYGDRGVLSDVYSYFYPQEDIKSADPVTYDDQGNVIPLSERFNPENKDIRYSLPKIEKPTDNKYIKMVEEGATHIGEYDVVPKSKEPKKTILAWKALVVKPGAKNNPKDKSYGNMYPPQVHQVASTPYGVWLYANEAPKKLDKDGNPVLTKFGRPKVKEGMTYRPAWHFGDAPYASQFMSHAYGFFDDNGVQRFYMSESKGILVWALCEMAADENYQDEADMAGHVGDDRTWDEQQASLWYLPENGYYKYMTNRVDPNSVTWYLSDKMRIVQTITDAEMREILTWIKEDGSTDLEFNYPLRLGGKDVNPADYGIPVGNVVGDGIDYVDRWKNQFREIAMNGDIDITQSHFYYVPSTATNYGSYETVSFSKEVDDHSQELLKTKKDAKILSVNSGSTSVQTKNFEAATGVKVKEAKTLAGRKKIIESARKEGYDIVEFKTEGKLGADVVIVNPDAVIRNYKFNNVSERHGRTDAVKYSMPKSNSPYSYDRLISKPDMPITTVGGNVPNNRADLIHQAKQNAAKVGTVDPKTGSVSVHVDDNGADVVIGTDGLKHGLQRGKRIGIDSNSIVTVKAGEIIKNSIQINEAIPKKQHSTGTYVLIGVAKDTSGGLYVVRSMVNRFSNELASLDVLYAMNAKKEELAATKSPRSTAEPLSVTSSTISIAKLLDLVNQHFPDILPEEVLKHYGYDARPEGDIGENMLYKSHNTNSMSSRQLLADAFDELVQTPKERQLMDQYRANISKVEEVQDRLKKVRGKIRELSKGNGNKAKIDTLNKTAADLAKLIDSYDRKLLEMEASKPLRDVLARAKSDAYQKAKQRGEEHLKKYQEKVSERFDRGVENRNKTAMKHKIQNVVKELNDLLLNESKKRHVPDSLKKAVASALAMVNMDTVGAEERAAKYAALIAKEEAKANPDQDKIDAYTVTMENIIRKGEKMGQRLKELRDAYEEIQESDDPDIANAYDPVIAGCLKELSQSIGDTPLRNMTIEQLSDVYDMYRMVLTRVRDANKTLLDNIRESISILASSVIGEVRKAGGEHKYRLAALDPVTKFMWNNLKPVYAMEHIGSATLTKVFDNVRAGEDTWAKDVTEAREYYLEKSKKYGYDSWDFDKKYRFQSASDLEFELTLEQVLSLYAYSKREQAHDHLRLGGFVFDSNIETYKDGKLIKYKVNTADAHQITPEILAEIIGTLTDKQKGFVDEMQDYLSTVMGAKGNEVTMKMYGVKLFKEKFYFPLKSAKQFMFEQNEVSGEVKIKNSGFTNKVVAKANNPVILSNFMEVWSGHVNDMSMYHAFVLPLEDFNRVFNYNSPKRENQPSVSVKGTIQSAYSPAAVHYVKNLITDLNGGARSDSTAGVINKMMGLFKKGAVFASLSVVVQQPSAIARAAALVDMKYFIGPKVDRKRHSLLWDEVKRYAPVAIIKEMGYFDTNMGKSTQDFITGKEYSSISEKMKALVSDSDYRDEILSKAPALADEMAWCAIWDAVKREMHDKHPGLDVKGEPFLMLAGSRFTEVITKTQVYDSVLSRSANMRSKDTGMKMATSFMAEPTTSINMIADALLQGKRGNRKYCISAIGAVIASNILNSILVSFVYAGRDDDEDETYVEKYIGTLTAEILDGMNPATYIPFIKDIVSIVQGYDVERSDMAVVSDLWNAYQKLGSSKLSTYRKVEGFAGSIAQIFGLPVKNIMRDVRGIYQTVMSFMNGQQTTKAGIGYAVKSALPGWMGGGDVSNQEQLYEAYLSGDDAHAARVETRYKDESAINSAMSSAIKDHYIAGDIDSETAKDLLVTCAGKDKKDAYWTAEEWEYESETGENFSKYNEFFAAVETGKNLKTVIKQYTDNGEKESTLKSRLSEHFKPLYIEMPNSERAGIKGYLLNAMTLLGDTREDAEEKIAKWQYEADYPELADRITYTQYTRWQTDGKPNGVSLELYTDVAEFRDDGTSSSAKSQEEVAAYIDSLPISIEQKDALWCCFWKESTLKKAPWH